ncbi:thiamin pyrophosphokinase 1 isoform X2 [Leptidea sinapis]|uniref:thiamin pyrophosphokinase 1 isoform X2 n=1 Tax=Leptidea sinapis TaxID=189913 RepID=UPI0021462C4C|nr:thiamin pyrophosphokinase 1 isoform X2 [Leptidea sinapis]
MRQIIYKFSRPVIKCWQWDITTICDSEKRSRYKFAIVILNRPISQKKDFVKSLWNDALVKMTVNGGTGHFDRFLNSLPAEERNDISPPDLITGDFDSIAKELLDEYKNKGCKVIHTPDQDDTDFTKAMIELDKHCQEHEIKLDYVVALCQNSGRVDQILGNIQTLFLVQKRKMLTNTNLYLMSDNAISFLLSPGDHVIQIPEETRAHPKAWCCLIPVGEPCHTVSTSGLKWNLSRRPLKFGDLVSTSNSFDGSKIVKIKCSHSLLWSMMIPSLTH